MLGTNNSVEARIRRSWLHGFLHVGTVLSVMAMFALMPGCAAGGGGGGGGGGECAAAGEACDADADCCDDLVCGDDGLCAEAAAPCDADEDCADDDLCNGAETCDVATGECADGTAVECDDGFECDEATGECVEIPVGCTTDEECIDDDLCNGAETCDVATGECVDGTAVECEEGFECDEATGECVEIPVECTTDEECADDDLCNGAETCGDDGFCADGTPVDCDDGFECDPATGECTEIVEPTTEMEEVNPDVPFDALTEGEGVELVAPSPPVPAQADEASCDCTWTSDGAGTFDPNPGCTTTYTPGDDDTQISVEVDCTFPSGPASETFTQDVAVTPVIECSTNGDCDDGLFCNGEETCIDIDPVTLIGICTNGVNPCAEDETCDEDTDECIAPAGQTFTLTLAQDTGALFTGASGDDTFTANLAFNAPTGTNIPTLQTGDSLNGSTGTDTLTAVFNFGAATTVSPTLAGIEVFNVTDFGGPAGGTIIAGAAITGLETINISSSTNVNVLTFNNLPALADVSFTNQAIGATFTFPTAASAGTGDTVDMSFSNFTATPGPTVTYTTGTTNGAETLNLESTGAANVVDDIVMNGTTLTRINITGDQQFTLTQTIDANVTTVDASGSTGGVTVFQNNASVFTFTGGSGNDTILLGGTYTTTDTLSGGSAGTDTIGGSTATLGGTTATQANVSNFDAVRITDAHTTALNVSHFGTIGTVTLDAGANGVSLVTGAITNASTGIALNLGARATDPIGAGLLNLTVALTGTSDTATFTLNDCDQAGNVTFTGVETLSLVSNLDLDGSAAGGGTAGVNTLAGTLVLTDTAAPEIVNITGTESLTITGAITANQISATNFTEPFIMGAATTLNGVTVNGGSGADTLFASAGADIVNGNAGNDILNPLAGVDIVTGGSGADIFRQSAGAADGADRQSITDFDDTVTTGDVFNLNSGLGVLTGTDNFATSASLQTHSASGNLAVNAAAEVVRVTSGTVADFTSANSLNGTNLLTAVGGTITGAIVGANRILICVADTTGNVGVYYASSADNAIIAGEITLVGVLQGANVAIANVVFNNFANGA